MDLSPAPRTYPSPITRQPVSLAFIQPRSVDDLARRRVVLQTR